MLQCQAHLDAAGGSLRGSAFQGWSPGTSAMEPWNECSMLTIDCFQILIDHHTDQLLKGDGGFPAKF